MVVTNQDFTNLFKEGLMSNFMSAYTKGEDAFKTDSKEYFELWSNDLVGKQFDYMVMDDLTDVHKDTATAILSKANEGNKRMLLMPRSHMKSYMFAENYGMSKEKAAGFMLTKEMIEDDLYGSPLKDIMYIDPTTLTKKELVALVMNLQGLVEGLVQDTTCLEDENKHLTRQIEIEKANYRYLSNKTEGYQAGLKEALKMTIDKLAENND